MILYGLPPNSPASISGIFYRTQALKPCSNHSDACSNHPNARSNNPNACSNHPNARSNNPNTCSNHSNARSNHPNGCSNHPNGCSNHPNTCSNHPNARSNHPNAIQIIRTPVQTIPEFLRLCLNSVLSVVIAVQTGRKPQKTQNRSPQKKGKIGRSSASTAHSEGVALFIWGNGCRI